MRIAKKEKPVELLFKIHYRQNAYRAVFTKHIEAQKKISDLPDNKDNYIFLKPGSSQPLSFSAPLLNH